MNKKEWYNYNLKCKTYAKTRNLSNQNQIQPSKLIWGITKTMHTHFTKCAYSEPSDDPFPEGGHSISITE